jgi:hypothetical protein
MQDRRVALISLALCLGIPGTACELNSATTGNEGNLEFSYTTVEDLGDFNKPLAVGSTLELVVKEAGTRKEVQVVAATTDDPGVLDVTTFLGDTVQIVAKGEGGAQISVRARVPSGAVVEDSVDMLARDPATVELRHRYPRDGLGDLFEILDATCVEGPEAAYLVDTSIVVGFDMWSASGQSMIGHGVHPVSWEPEASLFKDQTSSDPENITFQTGAEEETVLLLSTVDDEELFIHLIEAETIDGSELVGGFPSDLVPVGHTRTIGVAPTVGNLRVCQYPLDMEVTSSDGGICTVTGSATGSNAWLSVSVHGLSPGTCSFTVSFPSGGEDATGTFSVEVAE